MIEDVDEFINPRKVPYKYFSYLEYDVIVRVIKTRRLRWVGHVPRMEEGRSAFKIITGKPTTRKILARPNRR